MHDPAISHFFAFYRDKIGLSYHAFDPSYTDERLDESLHHTYGPGSLCDVLRAGIRSANLGTYQSALAKHRETLGAGKVPVIFSNQVLNDPKMNKDYPFWTLDGLHIHRANLAELTKNPSACREFEQDPERSIADFRVKLSLDATVLAFITGPMISYLWKK